MFFLTIFLVSIIIKYSAKVGMLDIPNSRSSHIAPTPRGAGVAMYVSYMFVLVAFHNQFVLNNIGFFIGLFLVFLVGVIDDNKEVSPKLKFIFIIIASLVIFFVNDLRIDTLGNWFGVELSLPLWIALPFTIFAITGFTNAINLIDGLDGLSGSISLVMFLAFFYLGYVFQDEFMQVVTLVMIVTLIAFLFFNWNPASIFIGDSGSLVLGFTIAAIAIRAIDYISITSVLFLTAIPILDTIIVMTRRMQRGNSPFSPDKTHIHHKFLTWRARVDSSVIGLFSLQAILSTTGVLLRNKDDVINLIIFIVILYISFEFLDERQKKREDSLLTKARLKLLTFVKEKISYNLALNVLIVIVLVLLSLNCIS
jgi:UDP-GlcNAc:undecaprenyl-phosphate GlcNAc-1-phosphate transferase